MNYNEELSKLKERKHKIIENAEENGYTYDAINDILKIQSEQIYVIHISINTLGCGESLGHFELYDKTFQIDEKFALDSSNVSSLEDFMEEVLFSTEWDEDFVKSHVFEYVPLSDWFYYTTENSHYGGYENIITFRFSYIESVMGTVSIIKCNPKILKDHKNIHVSAKSYILE